MLPVLWNDRAEADFAMLMEYLAERSPSGAVRLRALFGHFVERIAEHPYIFREGREVGTREVVVHPNYTLVYRIEERVIRIVNVLHTSQRYP